MKKNLIFLVVLLVCLIPTAVAVRSYQKTAKAPVDASNAVSITISDTNEKKYTLVKEQDGDNADQMIRYFLSLRTNAQPITDLPESLLGEKFYIVTIASGSREETYEYYFSSDPTTNYFRAPDGLTYKIAEGDAAQFIGSEYAESVYEEATMPSLILSHAFAVTPDSAVWQYRNYTGNLVDANVDELIAAEAEQYEIEGGLDLTFSTDPDNCTVTVTGEAGNPIYEGGLDTLGSVTLNPNEVIAIEVTAKWYQDPARSFAGTIEYSFSTFVTAPAEFFLGVTEIEAGKFVTVTGLNVTKPENVHLSSNMTLLAKPTFYDAGNGKAVALLPIDTSVPDGVYTLTFTYGSTVDEVALTVVNGGEKISNYAVPDAVISAYRTEDAVQGFRDTAEQLMRQSSATRRFEGYFLEGIDGDYQLLRGFGRDVYLNWEETPTYRNDGVDYAAAAGTKIVAANAGEVIFAGVQTYTGNMVVIDHGWGLLTWYWNLGSTSVSVGDIVSRGDVIGEAGQTGFTGACGAHIAMSAGGAFVSPYDTWADSSVAGEVIFAKLED